MKSTGSPKYCAAIGVDIGEIDPDLRPASQMRVQLDDEAVERYVETLDELPPIRLIYDATRDTHWLVDGCHTIHAARHLGRTDVRAEIKMGTRLEAFAEAAHANQTHGVRVTNADKHHRVAVAVRDEEMKEWSNPRIAEACGVSDEFVRKLRPDQLPTVGSSNGDSPPATVGKDGKKRRRRKPKKKARQHAKAESGGEPEAPSNGDGEPEAPDLDLWESDPDEPTEPAVDPEGEDALDLLALWDAEEAAIMVRYHAWPPGARAMFVMNLESLARHLRIEKHSHEIIDRSGEKW